MSYHCISKIMQAVKKSGLAVKHGASIFLVLLQLIIQGTSAKAQDTLDVLAIGLGRSRPDPVPQGDFETLTVPIKRAQNLLLIEARINGTVGNFILDTGAPHLVLNKTYFRQGKLSEGIASSGVTGDASVVYHMKVDSLVIGDLFYTDVDADIVNLGHIEDAKGVKILGLLGANLFSSMKMEIDLRKSVLYLTRLSDDGQPKWTGSNGADPPSDLTRPDLVLPFETANNIIFVNGTVEERKLRFCLDTGAETNVLSNSVGNKVLNHFHLMSRTGLGGSTRQTLNVLSGQLDEIIIGNHAFKKMPVILTDLSGLQTVYNTTIHGILGYDFLSSGRVIINFKKRELSMYFYKEEGQ